MYETLSETSLVDLLSGRPLFIPIPRVHGTDKDRLYKSKDIVCQQYPRPSSTSNFSLITWFSFPYLNLHLFTGMWGENYSLYT